MNYLLFVVYLILLCWLLTRVPFIKKTGINNKVVIALFCIKIIAGITIGWMSLHLYGPGNDYWEINNEAWKEYQLLFSDPKEYFTNLFTSGYPDGYGGIFGTADSYWNDLTNNLIIKLVSVFNIISRGNYYINSLFFNFFVFFGHVALYHIFIKIYPGRSTLVIIGCFLLPSTLYFVSGIHKDGMVFLLLAVLIYSIYQSLLKNRFSVKRLSFIFASLVLLFFVRNFVALALVPALLAWIIASKTRWSSILIFTSVYILTALLFFNISSVSVKINPPEIIVKKQAAYKNLPVAATQIELASLEPSLKSFISNMPQALGHVLLLPYPGKQPISSLLPFSFELFFYLLLLLLLVFYRRKDAILADRPFLFFALFFTFTIFLFIGYTVPTIGSLVRYRSLYFPLIITPILCGINWKNIKISI